VGGDRKMVKKVLNFLMPFFITFALSLAEYSVLPIINEEFFVAPEEGIYNTPIILVVCFTALLHLAAVILTMVFINNNFKSWLLSILAFPAAFSAFHLFLFMFPQYFVDYYLEIYLEEVVFALPIAAALALILFFLHKMTENVDDKNNQ
jgi:hypothetical protein